MSSIITVKDGSYVVSFRYDRMTVDMLKSLIPSTGRGWNPKRKVWLVSSQYKAELQSIFSTETIPDITAVQSQGVIRLLEIRYVGRCKERGDGSYGFGYEGGKWGVIFSEKVLRGWFEGFSDEFSVLPVGDDFYALLGIKRIATPDEIKKGYRRMALQWHPDTCREVDAHERFLRIGEANEVLSNPGKRARYDIGLTLENSAKAKETDTSLFDAHGYRSPLRCGFVAAEGYDELNRFVVTKILGWEDIIKDNKVLVTSWGVGDKHFTEEWI